MDLLLQERQLQKSLHVADLSFNPSSEMTKAPKFQGFFALGTKQVIYLLCFYLNHAPFY